MRGANCFTDHFMVRIKLRISAAQPRRARPPTSGRRKAVAAVEVLTRDAIRNKFRDSMSTGLQQRPRQSGPNGRRCGIVCVRFLSKSLGKGRGSSQTGS